MSNTRPVILLYLVLRLCIHCPLTYKENNRFCFEINRFSIFLLISMQTIVDFVSSSINNYRVTISGIVTTQGRLNAEMRVDGWISLILSNRKCVVLLFNNGVFMNQGFVVNDEKVLKVLGNHQIGDISYNEESLEEGIVDLDHGSRFEGIVLKNGKIGIPFGYGEMYDDNGLLIYKGIMINWKRFGYGTSYHDNGSIEYEGYWCDDNRFGSGKVYNRKGKMVNECSWYNGCECVSYQGNGNNMCFGVNRIVLSDNSQWNNWDVSWFLNLESLEIGNNSFRSIQTFKIDGLRNLKRLKINKGSFTKVVESDWDTVFNEVFEKANDLSKSFHIINCESLESIEICEHSFSDFAAKFELLNLPLLQSLKIGQVGSESWNFYYCSFELKGTKKL